MKRKYSQEDVERILKGKAQIPHGIDKRIQMTYQELGLTEEKYAESSPRQKVRRKASRGWAAAAVAAIAVAALGITAFAAVKLLDVEVEKKDGKVEQKVSVAASDEGAPAKEAHAIEVAAGYVPEGYVYHTDGPYTGKYHNDATGGSMEIVPYNAAELYYYSAIGGFPDVIYDEECLVKTVDHNGTVLNVFKEEPIYEDDETVAQQVYLFDEEEGYVVWVYVSGIGIADDEAEKVAESLTITVLDETVPYATDEEIAQLKKSMGIMPDVQNADGSSFCRIGDTITDPTGNNDAQFVVKDIRIMDSLPLDEYAKENYIEDYDSVIAPLLNEDGMLKEHRRYTTGDKSKISDAEIETVDSVFVVADVEITNTRDTEQEIFIAPNLELLRKTDSGTYESYSYLSTTRAYNNVMLDRRPVYQSVQQFTEKHAHIAKIPAGGTITCTFAYVADKDCLEDAYLSFFHTDGNNANCPYVKVE